MSDNAKSTQISSAGHATDSINATFSPQFLALLSEHLYSSPNKAFEELISNSWDANASEVYVRIPEDLKSSNAAIWILDNGVSMDVSGLAQLWSIASSTKRDSPVTTDRKQIGKFGIGKLATYVLANELTYICKASDGVIRLVTMDYRRIDEAKSKHLDQLELLVREVKNENELYEAITGYEFSSDVIDLIKKGVPPIEKKGMGEDEFGGAITSLKGTTNTWTLAILTSLKEEGKSLQAGWIRRLLSTALPLGSSISIEINKNIIKPSKSTTPIQKTWKLGPDLDFDEFTLEDGTTVKIEKFELPYPHIKVEGLGEITGTATLYESNIRGGKSDSIGESNGFFVNVLGRVINPEDNLFKMSDLNLSVLSQFRAAIRVDELDKQISANREAVAESLELKKVKGLLRKLFNLGRREFTKIEERKFEVASRTMKDDLGSVPVATLNNLIQRSFENNETLPPFVQYADESELRKEKDAWIKDTKEDLSKSINTVEFRSELPENSLVKYDLLTRSIVINKNHPFAKENTHTSDQINTLKDTAIVDLLTDAYILNCGISTDIYNDITQHRDRAMRLIAQIRRNSAAQIISSLNTWKADAKPFEHIVGDSLEYLGLSVVRYGNSGEPEGVATAFISPMTDDLPSTYTLTYDAKSTKHLKAKTGNVNMAGLARHKKEYNANYALVVAPDFQEGALAKEAHENKVTPMTGNTLAKLISITVGYGPISLERLKGVFDFYQPNEVDQWVDNLELEMKQKSIVDLQTLVNALDQLVTKDKMDILGCDVIAQKYRELTGSNSKPTRTEIAQVFRGLSLVAPNAVFIDPIKGFDVFIFTRPSMLIQEIKRQTQSIPTELKLGSLSENI